MIHYPLDSLRIQRLGRVNLGNVWKTTSYLCVTNSHVGSGKGFHFIPEIGEEVLVGFESGNAEKPFVLGTHYNGSETSGYHTSGNDVKAIKTRSGIETLANDAEGSWKQSTPDGNYLQFDGQGNATLNIPKNFNIMVGNDVTITIGGNLYKLVALNENDTISGTSTESIGGLKNTYIGMDMMTHVTGKLVEVIQGDVHTESKKERNEVAAGKAISKSEQNTELHSDAGLRKNAAEKTNTH
ncbi:phage baseplate assembly protein V [Flavobacterium covae]